MLHGKPTAPVFAIRVPQREEVVECANLGDDQVNEGAALIQKALRGPGVELIRPGDLFASGAELEKVAEDVVAKLGLGLRAQRIAGGGRGARLWSTELVLVAAERSAPLFPEFHVIDKIVGVFMLRRRTARRRGARLGGKLFLNRRRVEGERGGFVGASWRRRQVAAADDAGAVLVTAWRPRAGDISVFPVPLARPARESATRRPVDNWMAKVASVTVSTTARACLVRAIGGSGLNRRKPVNTHSPVRLTSFSG